MVRTRRRQQSPAPSITARSLTPVVVVRSSPTRGSTGAAREQEQSRSPSRTFKLPDFWEEDIELWLRRVEGVFRRHRIVSSIDKFDAVLEKVPNSVLKNVRDVVKQVDETTENPYGLLKERLLFSFKPSPRSLAKRLVDFRELGGDKPSQLMAAMLSLLPEGEPAGFIFMELFLRRMPVEIREHLIGSKLTDPQQLAECADELWEARNVPGGSVAAIAGRAASPRRKKSPRRSHAGGQKNDDGLCYYHSSYGERANKCRPPCTWQGNAVAGAN